MLFSTSISCAPFFGQTYMLWIALVLLLPPSRPAKKPVRSSPFAIEIGIVLYYLVAETGPKHLKLRSTVMILSRNRYGNLDVQTSR